MILNGYCNDGRKGNLNFWGESLPKGDANLKFLYALPSSAEN